VAVIHVPETFKANPEPQIPLEQALPTVQATGVAVVDAI